MPLQMRTNLTLPSSYSGGDLSKHVKKMTTAAFMLTVDGKAFIEDMVGGHDQPQYLKILKWRLFELLAEIDLLLSDSEVADPIHCGAISLEYGLKELIHMGSHEIMDSFQLNEKFEDEQVDLEQVFGLWEIIVERFPGRLPEAMEQEGQDELLLAIKNWSRICSRADMDTSYLKKMLNDV